MYSQFECLSDEFISFSSIDSNIDQELDVLIGNDRRLKHKVKEEIYHRMLHLGAHFQSNILQWALDQVRNIAQRDKEITK